MNKRFLTLLVLLLAIVLLTAACQAPPAAVSQAPAAGTGVDEPSVQETATPVEKPTEEPESATATPEPEPEPVPATATPEPEAEPPADTPAPTEAAQKDTEASAESSETPATEDKPNPLVMVDPERPGFTQDGSPTLGDPDAEIVIVDFSDFQ